MKCPNCGQPIDEGCFEEFAGSMVWRDGGGCECQEEEDGEI